MTPRFMKRHWMLLLVISFVVSGVVTMSSIMIAHENAANNGAPHKIIYLYPRETKEERDQRKKDEAEELREKNMVLETLEEENTLMIQRVLYNTYQTQWQDKNTELVRGSFNNGDNPWFSYCSFDGCMLENNDKKMWFVIEGGELVSADRVRNYGEQVQRDRQEKNRAG